MATDEIYEACLSILGDTALEEEDKTEKLEDFVRQQSGLSGKPLEKTVLDVLWRYRNAGVPASSPNITIRKSASPAPWQLSRSSTPVASPRSVTASPAPGSLSAKRPGFTRVKSSAIGSPFSSPRPSPRLPYSVPQIPHSPSLNAYEFDENGAVRGEAYVDDQGSENVDWLVNDEAGGNVPVAYMGDPNHTEMMEMSPYDLLRSVLRDDRSDEEIEKVLDANGYDLSAAVASLMEGRGEEQSQFSKHGQEQDKTYLVGKSLAPSSRPLTPAGQAKSPVVCRYWLQTGQCLRADCRFSHNLSNHVCKYWLAGNCLAGDSCIFSHDPSSLMNNLSMNNNPYAMTPPFDGPQPYDDYTSFPALGSSQPSSPGADSSLKDFYVAQNSVAPPAPAFNARAALAPEFIPSRPQSRPSSRHQSPGPRSPGILVDDGEAFPTLGSAAGRPSRKHHGKRGHGHGHGNKEKENNPSSLADIVKFSPAQGQAQSPRKTLRSRNSYFGRENSGATHAIPAPEHIPWLETGDRANKAYLKARQEAIRHGTARNKFLQSAAQAWHRNDARAAKTLSLRGQSENDLMREAHRTAAKALYEDRNQHLSAYAAASTEMYIDLHGLHPAEAVAYLVDALATQRPRAGASAVHRDEGDGDGASSSARFLYAIVGTGHHSRGGKDRVGKAVRSYLGECGYAFREFAAPGDKASSVASGGILGVDVTSGDATRGSAAAAVAAADGDVDAVDAAHSAPSLTHGKVRILKAEDVEAGR